MSEEKILFISFVYILLNLVLFILYKFTKRLKILHKVMSVIDNLIFILFLGYLFYRANPLLVILVPCVLLIVYPVTWGLNKEISDEELFLFSRRRYLYWNESLNICSSYMDSK